jgi:quercetin dioxygenase-like cupin family protein
VLGGGSTVVRVLVAEESTTVLELELAPGSGAGPHVHTREDETIAVLDGALAFEAAAAPRVLRAGEAVFVPRGTEHAFANEGEGRVRAHVVCVPGGLERFFREVARAGTEDEAATAAERAGLRFG